MGPAPSASWAGTTHQVRRTRYEATVDASAVRDVVRGALDARDVPAGNVGVEALRMGELTRSAAVARGGERGGTRREVWRVGAALTIPLRLNAFAVSQEEMSPSKLSAE